MARNRKPLALGWLTLARLKQCAPSILDARISRHSSRSLSRPWRSTIGCCLVAKPSHRAVSDRRASACGQATQLTFLPYPTDALCANKFSRKQGVFGHRAILICLGIETWLGDLSRTTPSSTCVFNYREGTDRPKSRVGKKKYKPFG